VYSAEMSLLVRMVHSPELTRLFEFSARMGHDPLLTQASSGNTSIKCDGKLWIKASGTWLANAGAGDTFLPLPLDDLRRRLAGAHELSGIAITSNGQLRHTSIETAMHAALPQKVVVHLHSVNAIAWAVRADGAECLGSVLSGLDWAWIPYVPSGLPLARCVQEAIASRPGANVFILANHGLVICGDTSHEAEEVLAQVERCLALPVRDAEGAGFGDSLWHFVDETWMLPESTALHRLGTNAVNYRIATGGVLFPCHAVFLGSNALRIEEGKGVLVNRSLTVSQKCMLGGLLDVVERIDSRAPVRYLSEAEIAALATEDAHQYHMVSNLNAPPFLQPSASV